MSLRDVHAITAIPLPCLAAIEEGNLGQLPSPVYARGYVRSYAEAVRLDGDRLALELWRNLEEPRMSTQAPARTPRDRSTSSAGARPGAAPRKAQAERRQPSSLAPLRTPASPWVPKGGRGRKAKLPLPRIRSKSGRMMKPSRRRPRRDWGRLRRVGPILEGIAIVALVLVIAAVIWDVQRGDETKKQKGAPVSATGTAPQAPTSAAPAPDQAPAPATIVPPLPVAIAPVSDTGSVATYATGRDRYAVLLQATDAPCWVEVRAARGGPVLFQGTLKAGENRAFDAQGTLWLRLGALGHAAVAVEGHPLTLPAKPSMPYNIQLQK